MVSILSYLVENPETRELPNVLPTVPLLWEKAFNTIARLNIPYF